jgi:hypothetical protein
VEGEALEVRLKLKLKGGLWRNLEMKVRFCRGFSALEDFTSITYEGTTRFTGMTIEPRLGYG